MLINFNSCYFTSTIFFVSVKTSHPDWLDSWDVSAFIEYIYNPLAKSLHSNIILAAVGT